MKIPTWGSRAICFGILSVLPLQGQPNQPAAGSAFQEQLQRGRASLAARRYPEAVAAFKKANKLQQNACVECYLGVALSYVRMGQRGNAMENCDKVLASTRDDVELASAHNIKGTALMSDGEGGPDVKKMTAAEAEFRSAIKLNPSVPTFHMNLALTLLRQSKDAEAMPVLESCLALNPEASVVEQAKKLIADPRRGREKFAPQFRFTTAQGQDISLEQLGGKVVVLDFWATWCPPCRASVPELKDLTKKYPTEKLALISISADHDGEAWREFIAKKGMNWPQFWDTDHKIIDAFSVRAFPTYLVIDGEGIIRQRIVGEDPQKSVVNRLKDTLKSLPQLNEDKKD